MYVCVCVINHPHNGLNKQHIYLRKYFSLISFHYRLGETCSHVGATLYKIEAAVRIGMTTNAPTDLPCQWNQTFTKSIVGSPVTNINLYSDAAKEELSNLSNRSRRTVTSGSYEDEMEFINDLYTVQPKTVALHLFKDYDEQFIQTEQPLLLVTVEYCGCYLSRLIRTH